MTQPPPEPPFLEYRTPRGGPPFQTRNKASRHARGNGIGCVVMSLCCGPTVSSRMESLLQNPQALLTMLGYVIVCLYILSFLVCGVLYIIAGDKIRRPNVMWEKILVVSSWIHIGIVFLTLLDAVIYTALQGHVDALLFFGVPMNVAIVIALAQTIRLVYKTRQRGE